MVNRMLKRGATAWFAPLWDGENRGKSEVSTVNEFLSKRFKFADNSRFIRFE